MLTKWTSNRFKKDQPQPVQLASDGIVLTQPRKLQDVSYVKLYKDELEETRKKELKKMEKQLQSSDPKQQQKGAKKKEFVAKGEQLVMSKDDLSKEELEAFFKEHYPLNTNFMKDLETFEANGSVLSELPDSMEGFTENGKYPLESRVGFRASDGSFWAFENVELNGNDLEDAFEGSFRNVVVHAYQRGFMRRRLWQILHTHREPLEFWGFEQEFIAPPGGRGSTLNAALTELNEETQYQLETNIKSLQITGWLDEPRGIRHYFIEVKGFVNRTEAERPVQPTVFEGFSISRSPKNKKEDPVDILVPRRLGYFDAVEVFKAQVSEGPKRIRLKGSQDQHMVHVDLQGALSKYKMRRTENNLLMRFGGAKRLDIYQHMLKLAKVKP